MDTNQTLEVRGVVGEDGVVRTACVLRDHRSELLLLRTDGTVLAKVEVTMWIENTGASVRIRQDPSIHIEHMHYNTDNLIIDYGGLYVNEVAGISPPPGSGDIYTEEPVPIGGTEL